MALTATSPLIAALLSLQPGPQPDTNQLHVYPQSPGCTTTLQACIDNAIDGDIIDIATNAPIDEDLAIARTLVLRPRPGFSPVIGGGNDVRGLGVVVPAFAPSPSRFFTIEGLTFINVRVTARLAVGSGHAFTFRNNTLINDLPNNTFQSLFIGVETQGEVTIENNIIRSTGTGLLLQVRNGGLATANIQRNVITSGTPSTSADGIFLDLGLNGDAQVNVTSNIVYGTGGFNFAAAGINLQAQAQADVNLSHNTVYGIQGVARGISAGLEAAATGSLKLFNNSVSAGAGPGYFVRKSSTGTNPVTIENNHSFANAEADFLRDVTLDVSLGDIALTDDPLFVNAPGADFQLGEASPLIDAGTDDAAQGSFSPDAAGHARPAGANSDVGALEFGAEPVQLLTSVLSFTGPPMGVVMSAPYPGPLNSPAEPFVSGQISLDAVDPSTLFFDDWIPDPLPGAVAGGANPQPPIYDLALNGAENLIIRSTVGPVLGMGIEFNDTLGGSSPSSFTLTALIAGTVVGQQHLRTPNTPPLDFIGLWSPVAFDELQISELLVANENEFFGQVFTSQVPASLHIFSDGFE